MEVDDHLNEGPQSTSLVEDGDSSASALAAVTFDHHYFKVREIKDIMKRDNICYC